MKEQTINDFARSFVAVLFGVLTAIVTAAALVPLINLLFDNFYSFLTTPSPSSAQNKTITIAILFTWLFISSIVGGFICSRLSNNREMILVTINSLVSIVIIFIFSKGDLQEIPMKWVIILGVPIGNAVGARIAVKLKK